MLKTIKIFLIITLNSLLLFFAIGEIYSHIKISQFHKGDIDSNRFLERMLLYGDVNHFMDGRINDDLNSDNIRYHRESSDIKQEDTSVIFLGDSFVFGFLLNRRAAIPYQFEEIARSEFPDQTIHGINFGWVSASPYLELNLLKRLGHQYKPDVVILDLDIGDFSDDIRYRSIHERQRVFFLASYLPFTTMVIENILLLTSPNTYQRFTGFPKSELFVNEMPKTDFAPLIEQHTLKDIEAIYQYTKNELNAQFILVINPKTFHYNENESPNNWLKHIVKRTPYSFEIFEYFKDFSKTAPYPIVSLLPAFQQTDIFPTAFDQDAHWNRDGYRIAASEIVEQCKKLGCFKQ